MKKLFLSLAVVMSVSMFSCNGGADANADSESIANATAAPVEEVVATEVTEEAPATEATEEAPAEEAPAAEAPAAE